MRRNLPRYLLAAGIVLFVICAILLLDFTAPNPTGRRYSSVPINTLLSTTDKGIQGEDILAADLHLPNNNSPDQLVCFCNSTNISSRPPLNECRTCSAYAQTITTYRRPDFFGKNFVAEVKNAQGLLYEYDKQLEQISDYAIAAKSLGIPLWLYVRVNSEIHPEYYRIVEATGGAIVHYLTEPGYIDPVDRISQIGLFISLLVIGVAFTWLWVLSLPAKPKVSKPRPAKKAPADFAEDYLMRRKAKAQKDIDTEDSRPQ